jgi:protein-serine/threonine kinase
MAQVTNGPNPTAPQITETESYRRRKVRFGILPDGKHEHSLVNIRTEITIAETLRNLIREKWKKRQGQVGAALRTTYGNQMIMSFKDERDGYKGKPTTHEKYGKGNKGIGYGRSGNVRLSRKTSFNNQAGRETADIVAVIR